MEKLGTGILEDTSHNPGRLGQRCLLHFLSPYKDVPFQFPGIKMRDKTVYQAKHGRLPTSAFPTKYHTFSA